MYPEVVESTSSTTPETRGKTWFPEDIHIAITPKFVGKWTVMLCEINTELSYVVDGLTTTEPTGVGELAQLAVLTASVGPSAKVTVSPLDFAATV